MKILIISAVFLVTNLSLAPTNSLSIENLNTREAVFRVDGMTCGMCALTLRTALKKLDGVQDVVVNYKNKEARILYQDTKINKDLLIKSIEDAGNYEVTLLDYKNDITETIAVGKGPDALFLTPNEKFLYVANVEDTFISVIDTKQDKVIKKIDVTDYPWGFTRLGNSNLVAVSSWDKGIDIIDFTKHEVVQSKLYEFNLGGIASTQDGKYVFVVAPDKDKAFKIDANSLDIIDEFETGDGPDGIGISKDNKKIYTANTKDGTISIINLEDNSSKVKKTGGKPELIHSNHDHSKLYVSNFYKNMVHVLNTENDKIIKEINGLDGPEEAVLSKSQTTLYIVNFNNSKVYTYDAVTYEKLDKEYSVGNKPIGIAPADNGTKLYISNYGDNSITVINTN